MTFLFYQFYGCGMEASWSHERTNGNNGVSHAGLTESVAWLGSILPASAMMMMHQEDIVHGGLIVCYKEAGMSLLHDD